MIFLSYIIFNFISYIYQPKAKDIMELHGTVKKIFETQTFSSGFQKREMILLTQEQYPQPISIEFLSEKISLLDRLSEGDEVSVSINIRGREWTNPQGEIKYFNSITGWKIDKSLTKTTDEPVQVSRNHKDTTVDESGSVFDEDDDLPF